MAHQTNIQEKQINDAKTQKKMKKKYIEKSKYGFVVLHKHTNCFGIGFGYCLKSH